MLTVDFWAVMQAVTNSSEEHTASTFNSEMKLICSSEHWQPPARLHGVTTQKTTINRILHVI
jgi:hypothetical protein